MSFDHILNKLAEKKALEGDSEFAYRLVEAAEKAKECDYCGAKKGQMMKRKGKSVCNDCAKMKTCSLKGCGAKMMQAEMHKKGGKLYCCSECAKKDMMQKSADYNEMLAKYAHKKLTLETAKEELSPLGISIIKHEGEYCVNFKGEKEKTAYYTDDLGDAISTGKDMAKRRDKKASNLSNMLAKYAGIEDLKKWQAEHGKGKSEKCEECGKAKCECSKRKSSTCPDCGKKKCECSTMTSCAGSNCKAKMQKRHMHMAAGKHYCCAECASEHMNKKAYASKDDHSKHYHSAIEKLDGHVKTMGGDSQHPIFVFDSKEALNKAKGIVPVFLGRQEMHKDGKHMLKITGPKKESINAGDLLRKYAMDLGDYSGNPGFGHEGEDYKMEIMGFGDHGEEGLCEICFGEPASHRCRDCKTKICDDCMSGDSGKCIDCAELSHDFDGE